MAKSFYGLDIGSFAVKMVEVENDVGRYKLKGYSIVEIYGKGEEYDAESVSYSRQVEALRNCFKQMKINPRRVKNLNCSMGGTGVAVKQIRSIPLAVEELESSLSFEARKHLPLDDTDAILDFQILDGGTDSSQMEILLVATTKKEFEYKIKLLRELGVKPRIIDAESTALVNSYLIARGKPVGEGALVFLDIGARFSSLTIFADSSILFSREIPIGGHKLTEDIRTIHDLDYQDAENLKKERGMGAFLAQSSDSAASIRVARRMAVDGLIDEIKRSLRYYSKETGVREFDKILISGGAAAMPNFNSHLAQALSMNVELYNPCEMFTVPPGFSDGIAAQLATACGLALREEE